MPNSMPNSAYWKRRKATLMFDEMQKVEDAADDLAKIYANASAYLAEKMSGIFDKFKNEYGLTDEEAARLLKKMRDPSDIEELRRLLRNSSSSVERDELLKQLEAPAYQYRIARLKAVQEEIILILDSIAKTQKAITDRTLREVARDAYYQEIYDLHRRSGTAFPFNKVNERLIDKVMNSRWSGKNYSSRIWSNTDKLAEILREELVFSIATGRSYRDTARVIEQRMASGSSQARRLIRTEGNFIYTQMDMKGYEEAGIEEYMFLATLDLRTSAICRSMDGKIFKVSEQQPGTNCPPMHPWCRSTTIGVINREWLADMKRKARDPLTGKTIEVPMTMTYPEWYEKYVEKRQLPEKNENGSRNLTREQFERYRERGVWPGTYEEFIKAKEDPGTWEKLKAEYRQAGIDSADRKQYEEKAEAREAVHSDVTESGEIYGGKENQKIIEHSVAEINDKVSILEKQNDWPEDIIITNTWNYTTDYNEGYIDVTNDILNHTVPNYNKIQEIKDFVQDGVRYTVDDINVKLNHDADELATATLLQEKLGVTVQMMPEVNGSIAHVKTPDYLVNGFRWDRKGIEKVTSKKPETYIFNKIHHNYEQAENYVFDITNKCNLSDEIIIEQIKGIFFHFNLRFVNTVVLTKNGQVLMILKRK